MEINGCNINCRNLSSSGFLKYTSLLHNLHMFCVLFCECFTVIAKQRIDSGFFLFQAEQKKKVEKKKNKKILKTKKTAQSHPMMTLCDVFGFYCCNKKSKNFFLTIKSYAPSGKLYFYLHNRMISVDQLIINHVLYQGETQTNKSHKNIYFVITIMLQTIISN